jgi:hypothetical protein
MPAPAAAVNAVKQQRMQQRTVLVTLSRQHTVNYAQVSAMQRCCSPWTAPPPLMPAVCAPAAA